jgi:peptidoglycan/LPS O-acetylase OafA/YrhL
MNSQTTKLFTAPPAGPGLRQDISIPSRNIALDGLRGLAALGVVIFHYKWHFNHAASFTPPFQETLKILYAMGGLSVDFFFCLSGFVMYRRYAGEIASGQLSLKDFAAGRLARLYPLIVLTLCATALFQLVLFWMKGKFFIFENNSVKTFFLNLFFLQFHFFGEGFSFNAPSWTLNLEFFSYFLFYAVVRWKAFLLAKTLAVAAFFFFLFARKINVPAPFLSSTFQWCFSGFFIGGLCFFLWSVVQRFSHTKRNVIGVSFLVTSLAVAAIWGFGWDKWLPIISPLPNFYPPQISLMAIGFPSLILAFATSPFLEKVLSGRIFKILGDLSYSLYLWHLPIQLLILIILFPLNLNLSALFASRTFFIFYTSICLVAAHLSYHFFEKPAQKWTKELYKKIKKRLPDPIKN